MKAIQRRIITLLFCCTFFVVCVVELVSLSIMNRALDKDATQIMSLLCEEEAGKLNEYLHNIEQSVNTMHQAALEELEQYDGNIFEDAEAMEEYVTELDSLSRILADNTNGALAVYYRFSPELTDPTAGYFSVRDKNGEFMDFPTTDLSLYEKDDKEHVFWYYEPINAGKPVWLDPYPNENIGVEMISYVAPIFYEGQTIGIVGMDIDIVSWREQVEKISVYDTGFAALMDSEGNVIYHPDYKEGMKKEDSPEVAAMMAHYMEEGIKAQDSYSYKLDAQERAMVACKLDNGMSFAVVVPLTEISAPSRALMVQTMLAAVAIIAVFSIFSIRICKKIIRVAYVDVMTGSQNKTAYEEAIEVINQEIREKTARFALVMFDINNLKITNDTYGHEQGDYLIMTAASLMQQAFGKENMYRIGGDEFVIFLRQELADSYQERMDEFYRRLDAFNKEKQFVWGELKIAGGATVFDAEKDAVYGDVFRRADNLMYENKKQQKGQQ
ncbi:MAG: diguanylate cyclase [Lachnospiraceae bacterium]|nr:diguanylate cyclase [Lachnospiraceae bacterium]